MKAIDNISNGLDIIDSSDVIARIEYLEDMEGERDEDEVQELIALKALAEEAEGCADWKYGEALIRETHFKEYAQELAEDIGAIQRDMHWPYTCIDWEQAADELKMDYTTIDFDGVDYLIRS